MPVEVGDKTLGAGAGAGERGYFKAQGEEYRLFLSLFVWDDNPDKDRLVAILDEYCQDLLV